MIVVDASVIAPALADDDIDGDRSRSRLRGEHLVAPELVDLEVLSVIRRALFTEVLDARRAAMAIVDLGNLKLDRLSHRPLLQRAWELRENLTAYDASYVALAESLGVTLVTSDESLSRAPGTRCEIEYLGPSDL